MPGPVQQYVAAIREVDGYAVEHDPAWDPRLAFEANLRAERQSRPDESYSQAIKHAIEATMRESEENAWAADQQHELQLQQRESEVVVREVPLPSYDLHSPEHQQRLSIITDHLAEMERAYADTDPDAYIDRGSHREAFHFTQTIDSAVERGVSISYQDLRGLVYDPTDPFCDWSDRAVADSALSQIRPLIQRLEASGYRFVEDPEYSPVAARLDDAKALQLPEGWEWQFREHRSVNGAVFGTGERLLDESGQQCADVTHRSSGAPYAHKAWVPYVGEIYANSFDDVKALAAFHAVEHHAAGLEHQQRENHYELHGRHPEEQNSKSCGMEMSL
jgi:hypothetical protein